MGTHPTRCGEFLVSPDNYFGQLTHQIEDHKDKVIAIGEIGLDYDRIHFCEPDIQKKYFEKQLELADKFDLPLFLHCRNAHDDFRKIIEDNKEKIRRGGVVHSFDGTIAQANLLIDMVIPVCDKKYFFTFNYNAVSKVVGRLWNFYLENSRFAFGHPPPPSFVTLFE